MLLAATPFCVRRVSRTLVLSRVAAVAEKNRRRVTFWAVVECVLILTVAGVQVMRIRNFFEYKRMV